MIALAFFLFALMIVSWLMMPGGERKVTMETLETLETPALQPETQAA